MAIFLLEMGQSTINTQISESRVDDWPVDLFWYLSDIKAKLGILIFSNYLNFFKNNYTFESEFSNEKDDILTKSFLTSGVG